MSCLVPTFLSCSSQHCSVGKASPIQNELTAWKDSIFGVWRKGWRLRHQMRSLNRMQVRYPSSTNKKTNFTEEETRYAPLVEIPTSGGPYTLIMIDPDAGKKSPMNKSPGNTENLYYLHWLVVNIPAGGPVSLGVTVLDYAPPTPPPGTGQHRYHFVLYQQQNSLARNLVIEKQSGWNLEEFQTTNNLREVARKTIHVPQKLNSTNTPS